MGHIGYHKRLIRRYADILTRLTSALQDQLQKEQQNNAELQKKLKQLQGEKTQEKGPQAEETTQTEGVVPQADTTSQP